MGAPAVSVIVPVYNEEEGLPALFARLYPALDALGIRYEIVFINDGSRDRSAALLREQFQRRPEVTRVILFNGNFGQHMAIMAGFEHARGARIVTLDADLQNPPEEIPKLVKALDQGYDVVGSIRTNRQDTLFRRLSSRIVNRVVRRVTGVDMSDYGCMLRAYRRPIVDAMLSCHERSTFIPILANSFSRNTTEVLVTHAERQHGESKYGLMDLINLQFDLLTSITTAPLRLLSILGLLLAVAGFAIGVGLLLLRLFHGSAWGLEGTFSLFAVLFVFVGGQFAGMGLLGEYLGRVYLDVRARPRFFVEQVLNYGPASSKRARDGSVNAAS
jgi:undecaprenyl-phosphate 4-deoxy-4-formamido-L-arabinose transferase